MFRLMGDIEVTPGPFTIFKKKVFDDLGPYRHAHNTEDMEIAYRMQKNHYKIEHCNDAYVYTNTPHTIPKLFRQRLRWIYGFINNTFDYKEILFSRKHGNFSLFTLPARAISVVSVAYIFGSMIYSIGNFIYSKIIQVQASGFHLGGNAFKFDFFFLDFQASIFISLAIYAIMIFSVIFGRKMASGKWSFPFEALYFFVVFLLIAPFWVLKAFYNTILARTPAWR